MKLALKTLPKIRTLMVKEGLGVLLAEKYTALFLAN
jgi:hypothetical protein